jgi:pyruvate formate lyase activating enzyme
MNLTIAGCNYRCPYCPHGKLIHHYIPLEKISISELIKTLRPRLDFLDGVALEGGEPLLHRGLIDLLKELKLYGSLVKIKTNASKPKLIQILIDKNLVDYYSVFIPAPFSMYKEIVKYRVDTKAVISGIQMIRRSGINHEFRVKPVPGLIGETELLEIANYLAGAPRFVIERFKPEMSMDPKLKNFPVYSRIELKSLRKLVSPYFNEIKIY